MNASILGLTFKQLVRVEDPGTGLDVAELTSLQLSNARSISSTLQL